MGATDTRDLAALLIATPGIALNCVLRLRWRRRMFAQPVEQGQAFVPVPVAAGNVAL
jgi:hypothetical protein